MKQANRGDILMTMSGYELNDKDIETVLENLKAIKSDATREDAEQLLLETKMAIRDMTPEEQVKAFKKLQKPKSD